jgi:hypothetical protein
MGSKCREVASRVRNMHHLSYPSQHSLSALDPADPYFIDISAAEKAGLLPGVSGNQWLSKGHGRDGDLVGENKDSLIENPSCERTLTFVLESTDAGLGNALMLLWTFYALAKKQGREFFIDDTRWAYGQYTDIFQPPPAPKCRPPPRHEMLPCPPQAHHLVVSAATAKETFAGALTKDQSQFRHGAAHDDQELFRLAREGYEALYHLNKDDRKYVDGRTRDLVSKAKPLGHIVGMHIRHGDLHPFELQYSESYIPLEVFSNAAHEIVQRKNNQTRSRSATGIDSLKKHPVIVLASDDPTVFDSEEFAGSFRAQEQIRLASKANIQQVNPDRTHMHRFVDETFGWEGGFFATMFWNLGLSTISAGNAAASAPLEKTKLPPSAETLRLRSYIGRAYLMDLTVLAESSDTVICTVSATGCRLLAIMMGWERAIESGAWTNIDGNYGWMGLTWQ